MKLNQKGFGAIEGLLLVIALTMIVGVGFYVVNANKDKGKPVESSQTTPSSTKKEASKLTQYELKQEKLKLDYSDSYWKVADSQSGTVDCQPGVQVKQDVLKLNHGDFDLSFRFGQCSGKGGGICFDEQGSACVRETQNLGEVKVSSGKTLYILAGRATTDSGKTWEYDLSLDNEQSCKSHFCFIPATNIDDDLSSVMGIYKNQLSVSSLNQFAQLPEVKAAVEVLKTAKH